MIATTTDTAPRVLLVVTSDSGHLNPMIGVAQALERAGAAVFIFSCQDDVERRVRGAGLAAPCFVWRDPPPPPSKPARPADVYPSIAFTRSRLRPAWLRSWLYTGMVGAVPAQVARLAEVAESVRPDVVCIDSGAYAGAVVAERMGLPWMSMGTNLVPLTPPGWRSAWNDAFEAMSTSRAKAIHALGVSLTFHHSDLVSPWLNTVPTVEEFVPQVEPAPHHRILVGPTVISGARGDERPFPWDRLPHDRPIVYVSFGSIASPELDVYAQIVRAFGADEAHVVIAAKELGADPVFGDLPDHVTLVEYAPQLQLLSRAAVMITHGGYNSVGECLAHGVPMLVVPLLYDQSLNAHFVERAGVGRALEPGLVSADSIRAAILPMLRGDAPEREGALRIQRAYQQHNGSQRVAELLLNLAVRGASTPA